MAGLIPYVPEVMHCMVAVALDKTVFPVVQGGGLAGHYTYGNV